jgi:hypothetical protein
MQAKVNTAAHIIHLAWILNDRQLQQQQVLLLLLKMML